VEEMIKTKLAITVDVESEKLQSNFCPITTFKNLKKTEFLINTIQKKNKKKIPITWFIRCDDTISNELKHAGSFLDYISKFIIKREKIGDSFGFHPHFYKKIKNDKWEFEDRKSFQENIIFRAVEGWKKYFGQYPKLSRMGEAYMNNNIAKTLDLIKVKIDSTALPNRKRIDKIFNFDWTKTPEEPYKPSIKDYRKPGTISRNFIEIPFTMIPIKTYYDKDYYKRYFNLAFKNSLIKNALKNFTNDSKKIIATFHPHELFYKKNNKLFINEPLDLNNNINFIEQKFCDIEFVTLDNLIK